MVDLEKIKITEGKLHDIYCTNGTLKLSMFYSVDKDLIEKYDCDNIVLHLAPPPDCYSFKKCYELASKIQNCVEESIKKDEDEVTFIQLKVFTRNFKDKIIETISKEFI